MKKRIQLISSILLTLLLSGYSYISVPNTFVPYTAILSSKINQNYNSIVTGLNEGTKMVNLAELYMADSRVIDASRNIYPLAIQASGNVVISGTLKSIGAITGTLALVAVNLKRMRH